ncbi:PREDICTED: anaphase-promoting complex subunit 7-like, partial [Dipodomys ordii]|uniref:Anaphase-promoting complex subunit 7-like n=1 Tax=Dipodomys ordii TaxID=10020 RepID=A0A1S3GVY4_DIPOR
MFAAWGAGREWASWCCFSGLIECYLASNSIREAMVMANNVYKTLGANAQTLTLLASVCLEDPVTQEKAKTLLDKALSQRPDYIKAVVKKAELLSREQKYEDGIGLLRSALANQSDCVLHRLLGDFLVAVNEYQEAMDQYSIALRWASGKGPRPGGWGRGSSGRAALP